MSEPATGMPTIVDFALEPGLLLRRGITVFELDEPRGEKCLLRHVVTGEYRFIETAALLWLLADGVVNVVSEEVKERALQKDLFEEDDHIQIHTVPLSDYSAARGDRFVQISDYLNKMWARGYTNISPRDRIAELDLKQIAAEKHDPSPPSLATLYAWDLKLRKSGGNPQVLMPRFDERGGKSVTRSDAIVAAAVKEVVQALKENLAAKIRTCDVKRDIQTVILREAPARDDLIVNISWSTTKRRIAENFSAYEIARRNKTKAVADREFREWWSRDRATESLLVAETDDVDLGAFCIDDRSGLPFGRTFATTLLDQNMQAPYGWSISEQSRSAFSAISAVVHGILPKDPSHPDFRTSEARCEFYGKPAVIVFDNALYNHAKEIELAIKTIPVDVAWAKPKTPTEKADQEGWYARVKREFMPTQPGYKGKKGEVKALKEGIQTANMSVQSLSSNLVTWTFGVFANTPFTKDGKTARQRWHETMLFNRPRLPVDIRGMRLVATLHTEVRLRPEGILFWCLPYHHPFLKQIRERISAKAKVRIRYNPQDLGEIQVWDPRLKVYLPVLAHDQIYAKGLTLRQHKWILQLARENGAKNPALPDMLRYREVLRHETEQLLRSTKLRDRGKGARTGKIPEAPPTENEGDTGNDGAGSEDDPNPVTDLEGRIDQLDEVPLDFSEEGWNL